MKLSRATRAHQTATVQVAHSKISLFARFMSRSKGQDEPGYLQTLSAKCPVKMGRAGVSNQDTFRCSRMHTSKLSHKTQLPSLVFPLRSGLAKLMSSTPKEDV